MIQSVKLARYREELAAREARVATLEERQNAVLDNHTRMYWLRPPGGDTTRFGAQVFWRRDQQTWLVHVFLLPRLPDANGYQLWFVDGERKISAGMVATDAEGHGIVVVRVPPEARTATHAALSVEPAGGSPQPTGEIVLLGRVAD